ncbi:MAG TPA: hypothetical protein ENN94_01495 [Geoalkalibacter subterraneus]|uniref:Uncharacterized protein n=1 Tax=Geoalkalibacter subterraneus TaxID=483547 RepID=A0A831PJF5_9BACT|nr:hypothetical protein [Geoalkalibacter subterraneus]
MKTWKSSTVVILLVGFLSPGALMAEQLGRLFFTPEERMVLEQMRRLSPDSSMVSVPEQQVEASVDATRDDKPAFITLSGTVTRSSGASVVWLNGASYKGKKLPENVQLPRPVTAGQIVFRVPEKGKSYLLRPGQTLDVANGEVRASYERNVGAAIDGKGEPNQGATSALPEKAGK